MSRKTVTIYSKATGALLRTFEGPAHLVELQVHDGEAVYDGVLHLNCMRIDLATGQPVPFVPRAPAADFVWDSQQRIHVLSEKGEKKQRAQAEVDQLERKQQRALREFALGRTDARDKLQAIEDEIAEKRKDLK